MNIDHAKTLIIQQAKHLVKKLIDIRGNDKPPFLPEDYASLLGINTIEMVDLGKTSGVLFKFPGGTSIKLNKNHNLAKQHFSCAHEIGHILLNELKLEKYINAIEYRTFNPSALRKARSDARERLCDAAATELLMPQSIFEKYLSDSIISLNLVESLANKFQVSIQATAWRIAELSTDPCITTVWRLIPQKNIIKLTWKAGPRINNKRNRTIYNPKHAKVNSPSLLHKAFNTNDAVRFRKLFKVGNTEKWLFTEAKGYYRGEKRYVLSLSFPDS